MTAGAAERSLLPATPFAAKRRSADPTATTPKEIAE
jgi:hypothetical protein